MPSRFDCCVAVLAAAEAVVMAFCGTCKRTTNTQKNIVCVCIFHTPLCWPFRSAWRANCMESFSMYYILYTCMHDVCVARTLENSAASNLRNGNAFFFVSVVTGESHYHHNHAAHNARATAALTP